MQRQLDACRAWCAERGYTLDEQLSAQDLGVSGFTGANRTQGALATLLKSISEQRIPAGSYLLIENLDRLTREELTESVQLLITIVRSGMILVTLGEDCQEWTTEKLRDPMAFILLTLLLSRGHAESKRKSELITKAYDRIRINKKITGFGQVPGWLKIVDGKFELIPDKVDSVRRVFELTIAGFGSYVIARRANEEKWPVPTKAKNWWPGLPNRLLANRRVLGEMDFRTDGPGSTRLVLDTCNDWYPRIIDDNTFYAARAAIDARKGLPPRTTDHARNIFSGIAYCGQCGASLLRRAGGKGHRVGYGRYTCSYTFNKSASCSSYSALTIETAILPVLYYLYASRFSSEINAAITQDEVASGQAKLNSLMTRQANIVDAIEAGAGDIKLLVKRLKSIEAELVAAQSEVAIARAKHAALSLPDVSNDVTRVIAALTAPDSDIAARELRATVRLKLLRFIDHVWFCEGYLVVIKLKNDTKLLCFVADNENAKYVLYRVARNESPVITQGIQEPGPNSWAYNLPKPLNKGLALTRKKPAGADY